MASDSAILVVQRYTIELDGDVLGGHAGPSLRQPKSVMAPCANVHRASLGERR